MSGIGTRTHSRYCAAKLIEEGFYPKTIINCGVGGAVEHRTWQDKFPLARIIGIDVRRRKQAVWPHEYVVAVLGKQDGEKGEYCSAVRGLNCHLGWPQCNGRHFKIVTTTLDTIADRLKIEGPCFLWMDIEGSEINALAGAKRVLSMSPYLNVEMRSFDGFDGHEERLAASIAANGYEYLGRSQATSDRLFRKSVA